MSPSEITKMVDSWGKYVDSESSEKAKKKFEGVDGRKVTDLEQLLQPGPEIRPAKFNE
jgi:hypothetical protein